MDIDFNFDKMSDSMVKLKKVLNSFNDLRSVLSKIDLSDSGLASASLFSDVCLIVNNFTTEFDNSDSIELLIKKIRDIRNILIQNDSEMMDFFDEFDDISLEEFGNFSDNENSIVNGSGSIFGMIYDQTQYANIDYAGKNLASNGCGFFSVLSAITVKTGHQFSYEEIESLANYVNEEDNKGNLSEKTNAGRMECLLDSLSKKYNFTWYKGPVENIASSLNEGKTVISLTNGSSHFVAITGVLDNGNVIVNDTSGDAYRNDSKLRDRIDKDGFDLSNGELDISATKFDKDGDGLNDDVWYLDFDEDVQYGIFDVLTL